MIKKFNFALGWVENVFGKGQNADHQHFLLFSQCFQTVFFFSLLLSLFSWLLKVGIAWSMVSGLLTE